MNTTAANHAKAIVSTLTSEATAGVFSIHITNESLYRAMLRSSDHFADHALRFGSLGFITTAELCAAAAENFAGYARQLRERIDWIAHSLIGEAKP